MVSTSFSRRKPSGSSKDHHREKKIEDAKFVLEVIAEEWRESEMKISKNELNKRATWAARYLTSRMENGYEVQRTLKEHYNRLKSKNE